MSIRIMRSGEINCDKCGKMVAKIKSSEQVFTALENEARFTTINCLACESPTQDGEVK